MAAELVDCLPILVAARRFSGMGDADSQSLRYDNYVSMPKKLRRSTYVPFRRFGGMCGENSNNVSPLFFMVIWVHVFSTLCKRAMLMLWHAFMFLGLRLVGVSPLCFFCLVVFFTAFLVKKNCLLWNS
jgi:hypothetical protein